MQILTDQLNILPPLRGWLFARTPGATSNETIALRTVAYRLKHADGVPEFVNISFAAGMSQCPPACLNIFEPAVLKTGAPQSFDDIRTAAHQSP
jgi:hypothetical protein